MASVADTLRRELHARQLSLTEIERLRLALDLGHNDVVRYAAAHGVSVDDARLVFQRQRQTGRRRSRCHASVLGY